MLHYTHSHMMVMDLIGENLHGATNGTTMTRSNAVCKHLFGSSLFDSLLYPKNTQICFSSCASSTSVFSRAISGKVESKPGGGSGLLRTNKLLWNLDIPQALLGDGESLAAQHRKSAIELGVTVPQRVTATQAAVASRSAASPHCSSVSLPQSPVSPASRKRCQDSPSSPSTKRSSSSVSKKILQTEKREAEKLRKRFGEQGTLDSSSNSSDDQETITSSNSHHSTKIIKVRVASDKMPHNQKLDILKSLLKM